jgi:Protein of unknown function (DUF664)
MQTLGRQRHHVLGALEGLSEEQLRQPLLPSGWNSLSLVRHLALDVEHYWFRCIVAGDSLDFFVQADDKLGAWRLEPGESAEDILALYRHEIEQADAVISTTSLGSAPAQRDQWWGDWEVPDVRFILLHVITETACHAGHLDAVRELIDGRQWVVL